MKADARDRMWKRRCRADRRLHRTHAISIAAILFCALTADGQVIPSALPALPKIDLPVDVDKTVTGITGELDARRLTDLRRLKVRDLLRVHRRELEADPNGAPIVRSEVLAFSPSKPVVAAAQAAGFSIARERVLEGLDARIVVLHAPAGVSTRRALKRLRALDPSGSYDFNHVYTESGEVTGPYTPSVGTPVARTTADVQASGPRVRVGLVDAGVDAAHAVFRDTVIRQYGCRDRKIPSAHGTAVASLLVGQSHTFRGAIPRAELHAADVYCGAPTGGAVDAVADALAWMARERVPVVNLSLVGAANVTLENVIRLLIARGHLVVAAVGNDGPAAPPLYPAAYPNVVGVTAVDSHQRVLPEAERGTQVDFSAPGADMIAADDHSSFAKVRGTSFACPIVAGLLAAELREADPAMAASALASLVRQAIDLGPRGPDRTYGNGLVGESLRMRATDITSNGRNLVGRSY
jgi:subtilisin family serine protease